jgi:4-hydroxymandelate oxidase
MAASASLEAMAAEAPDAPRFAQMYVLRDRNATQTRAQSASLHGYAAIVASVDGGAVPYGSARRADDAITMPAGVAQMITDFDPSVTFADLALFREASDRPLVVKGVLRGDDARRCVDAGADAIYVSNHGGRIVDGCIDTASALTDVAAAVGDEVEVYVDGGVRAGVDVLRALALGARAVGLGRPILWGLALDGESGVRAVLDAFAADLRRAMAFCGAASVGSLGPDLLLASPA